MTDDRPTPPDAGASSQQATGSHRDSAAWGDVEYRTVVVKYSSGEIEVDTCGVEYGDVDAVESSLDMVAKEIENFCRKTGTTHRGIIQALDERLESDYTE